MELSLLLFAALVSQGSRYYISKRLTETCRSVVPRLREYKKCTYYWHPFMLQIFFWEKTRLICSPRFQPEPFCLHRNTSMKKMILCALCGYPDKTKLPKKAIIVETFRYSNSRLSATTFLNSSIMSSIKNITSREDDLIRKPLVFILVSTTISKKYKTLFFLVYQSLKSQ